MVWGKTMILAGTGHRPAKLGGYSDEVFSRLVRLAHTQLIALRPSLVISGMALGWDQALAQAAMIAGIPFDAYIPFSGQQSRWPQASRTRYGRLLVAAREAVIVVPVVNTFGEIVQAMQLRNERMVDSSDLVLALWNGTSGGTANCVRYAQLQQKPINNCWSDWEKQ